MNPFNCMVYLAAPYSSPDAAVVEARMKVFCSKDSELSEGGFVTVSPLLKHLLFINGSKLPSDWAYWERYSYVLLSHCNYLAVLKLPGWEESPGVQGEIKFAVKHGIEVIFLDPLDNALESFVSQAMKKINDHHEPTE